MENRGLDDLRRRVELLGKDRPQENMDPFADINELRERYQLLGEIERLERDDAMEGADPNRSDTTQFSPDH